MNKSLKIAASVFIFALVAAMASAQVNLSVEDFNRSDYGTSVQDLSGLNGGSNWQGAWSSNVIATDYEPNLNLSYSAAGYVNQATSGTSGTAIRYNSSANYKDSRTFAPSSVSTPVWFSYLGRSSDSISVTDIITMEFRGANNTEISFGSSASNFGISTDGNPATIQVATSVSWTNNSDNLVLGSIDPATGVLRVWLNPADVTSESALGTGSNYATTTVGLGGSINDSVSMELRRWSSSSTGKVMDAVRIAYGGTSSENLSAVVTGIPEPSSYVLLFSGAIALVTFVRRRVRHT